jgi:hypothetical protein
MCVLGQIEDSFENREPHLNEAVWECPICWCVHPAGYQGWRIPHPVAEELQLDEDDNICWVCSDLCLKKWCDTYHDEISEYEEGQES